MLMGESSLVCPLSLKVFKIPPLNPYVGPYSRWRPSFHAVTRLFLRSPLPGVHANGEQRWLGLRVDDRRQRTAGRMILATAMQFASSIHHKTALVQPPCLRFGLGHDCTSALGMTAPRPSGTTTPRPSGIAARPFELAIAYAAHDVVPPQR